MELLPLSPHMGCHIEGTHGVTHKIISVIQRAGILPRAVQLPRKGGIRIEDLVVARDDGYHCFYTYPKKEIRVLD